MRSPSPLPAEGLKYGASTTNAIQISNHFSLFSLFIGCFISGLFGFLGVLDPCKRFNPAKSYSFSNALSALLPKFTVQNRRGGPYNLVRSWL